MWNFKTTANPARLRTHGFFRKLHRLPRGFIASRATVDLRESNIYLSGGRDFFDIPDLGEAYGYGGFRSEKAGNASSVNFTPVPEPSTYALGAIAFIGLVLWKRHASAAPSVA
mgnify:FL=1